MCSVDMYIFSFPTQSCRGALQLQHYTSQSSAVWLVSWIYMVYMYAYLYRADISTHRVYVYFNAFLCHPGTTQRIYIGITVMDSSQSINYGWGVHFLFFLYIVSSFFFVFFSVPIKFGIYIQYVQFAYRAPFLGIECRHFSAQNCIHNNFGWNLLGLSQLLSKPYSSSGFLSNVFI